MIICIFLCTRLGLPRSELRLVIFFSRSDLAVEVLPAVFAVGRQPRRETPQQLHALRQVVLVSEGLQKGCQKAESKS